MAEVIESGVGTLNSVKQTAKGASPDFTSTTRPADRPKWEDGVLDPAKTLAESDYLDGKVFGSPSQYTKQVSGEVGNLVIQVEPANAGIYLAYILATDTVTGASDPYTHTITSDPTSAQPYVAFAQSVGQAVGPKKDIFWDAKLSALTLSSSTDQQELTYDMKVNALKGGQIFTTTPAKTENAEDPYLHSETDGQVTLDGTVTCEISESIVTIDRKQSVMWGNSIEPCQIVDGKGEITCSVKSVVTDVTLAKRNQVLYATATPTAGTRPVKDVFYGAISRKYVRSASRSLQIDTPRVAFKAEDLKVGPRRDGGLIEITFGGRALRSGATPALTAIAKTGDSAAYV